MANMKNLANCKPSEFLKQTNRIRKSVEKWLKLTDIQGIRKRLPKLPDDATEEERKEATRKQASENFSAILDAVMDEHPDETLEVLALACFVEPKDVDKHPMEEYIESVTQLMNNKAVLDFLSSLLRLGQTLGVED